VRQGSYGLVGARLELSGHEGRWSLALFGRNLSDELYAQNVIRQDPLVGKLSFWGAPRTFGIELAGRF
jgi:iron complex outermembrane receptor protein